jgi:hypothetical protein
LCLCHEKWGVRKAPPDILNYAANSNLLPGPAVGKQWTLGHADHLFGLPKWRPKLWFVVAGVVCQQCRATTPFMRGIYGDVVISDSSSGDSAPGARQKTFCDPISPG